MNTALQIKLKSWYKVKSWYIRQITQSWYMSLVSSGKGLCIYKNSREVRYARS